MKNKSHPTPIDEGTQKILEHEILKHAIPETLRCPVCLTEFHPKRITKIYCSQKCRRLAWEARHPRI